MQEQDYIYVPVPKTWAQASYARLGELASEPNHAGPPSAATSAEAAVRPMRSPSLTSHSSLNQASASDWLPSDHSAISRRVARDPGGSSSIATTRVMTGSLTRLP